MTIRLYKPAGAQRSNSSLVACVPLKDVEAKNGYKSKERSDKHSDACT